MGEVGVGVVTEWEIGEAFFEEEIASSIAGVLAKFVFEADESAGEGFAATEGDGPISGGLGFFQARPS